MKAHSRLVEWRPTAPREGSLGSLDFGADPNSTADDRRLLFFYDGNGNVVQLVDAAADPNDPNGLAAHYEYDAFGTVTAQAGGYAAENAVRFSTKPFDERMGLGDWGRRWYSAELGRWVSWDPLGYAGSLNLNSYSQNQPTLQVDPDGTHPILVVLAVALVVSMIEDVAYAPTLSTSPEWMAEYTQRHRKAQAWMLASLPAGGFGFRLASSLALKAGANTLVRTGAGALGGSILGTAAGDAASGQLHEWADSAEDKAKQLALNAVFNAIGGLLVGPGKNINRSGPQCWEARFQVHPKGHHAACEVRPIGNNRAPNAPDCSGWFDQAMRPKSQLGGIDIGTQRMRVGRGESMSSHPSFAGYETRGAVRMTQAEADALWQQVDRLKRNGGIYFTLGPANLPNCRNCATTVLGTIQETGAASYGLLGPFGPRGLARGSGGSVLPELAEDVLRGGLPAFGEAIGHLDIDVSE